MRRRLSPSRASFSISISPENHESRAPYIPSMMRRNMPRLGQVVPRQPLGDAGHLRMDAGAGAIIMQLLVDGLRRLPREAREIALRQPLSPWQAAQTWRGDLRAALGVAGREDAHDFRVPAHLADRHRGRRASGWRTAGEPAWRPAARPIALAMSRCGIFALAGGDDHEAEQRPDEQAAPPRPSPTSARDGRGSLLAGVPAELRSRAAGVSGGRPPSQPSLCTTACGGGSMKN